MPGAPVVLLRGRRFPAVDEREVNLTAAVEVDADDCDLPGARERLADAVHSLCTPVVEYRDGRVLTGRACWSRCGSRSVRVRLVRLGVGVMCEALEAWVAQIRELLDPPARWSLPNPCPACGVRTVYRIKDGEHLRMAALQVGAEGCECQSCRTVWTPDRFVWLARLLGYEMPAGVLE